MERIHSLYLHVPFCTWLCKYCDFNAYAVLEGLIPAYVEALAREIDVAASEVPIGPLDTVFIGGGTPSLLSGAQLEQLMNRVRAIGLAPGAEITMEANPSNVMSLRVEEWLAAGVNRLSIGVQSLQPWALRFLERLHSGSEALDAIRTARTGGFANINADLLYGVPGTELSAWLDSLDAVIAEGVTHLSAYELTVEAGTRLGQEVRTRSVTMPDADAQLEQYWAAAEHLDNAGSATTRSPTGHVPALNAATTSPAGAISLTWAAAQARTRCSAWTMVLLSDAGTSKGHTLTSSRLLKKAGPSMVAKRSMPSELVARPR